MESSEGTLLDSVKGEKDEEIRREMHTINELETMDEVSPKYRELKKEINRMDMSKQHRK